MGRPEHLPAAALPRSCWVPPGVSLSAWHW